MLLKEKIETINSTLHKLISFVKSDKAILIDITGYFETVKDKLNTDFAAENTLASYIFDEKMKNAENTDKTVIEYYIENNSGLTEEEKTILKNMEKTIFSVFRIKNDLKGDFEFYNLINEKTYNVLTLPKKLNFRHITSGNYLVARIFLHEGKYYLLRVNDIIPAGSKSDAYKIATIMLLENPEKVYIDNDDKLAEIEADVINIGIKFQEYFKKDEIITTTEYVDDLLTNFNDFVENGDDESLRDIDSLIKIPEQLSFFHVEELSGGADITKLTNSGFSSHEKIYDIGVMFDPGVGLLVLPFYATFKQIFAAEDYKSVEGYEDCILSYFNSGTISPESILRVYNQNSGNFMKIISEVLEIEEQTDIQELLHKYKKEYYAGRKFSPTTILYSSKMFGELMEINDETEPSQMEKVGRNEPCPCGSGKKYKKCCIK